ncbi:MAG: hypothetical protein HC821_01020 [Lewinella sp.]|nr:hypothetical protein [Lewinella sp.]
MATLFFSLCPGDGIADFVNFNGSGSLSNTAFLITNEVNVVLAINTTGSFDFDGFGTGGRRVYAVSFDGPLPINLGDDLDEISLDFGCGGISDEFLTINATGVVGGTVTTTDGDTLLLTCPGMG